MTLLRSAPPLRGDAFAAIALGAAALLFAVTLAFAGIDVAVAVGAVDADGAVADIVGDIFVCVIALVAIALGAIVLSAIEHVAAFALGHTKIRSSTGGSGGRRGDRARSFVRWRRRRDASVERTARRRARGPVDWAVDHLLERAARSLPAPFQGRFGEEWQDHRGHYRGWRLLWWALCIRATATRTGRELRHAELPRPER